MTTVRKPRKKLSLARKLMIAGTVVLSLILLVGTGSYFYALTMANKVKPLAYTGNPSIEEKVIADLLANDPENIDRFFISPDETLPTGLWDDFEEPEPEQKTEQETVESVATQPSDASEPQPSESTVAGQSSAAATPETATTKATTRITAKATPKATPKPTPVPYAKPVLQKAEQNNDAVRAAPIQSSSNIINILLIGSDTRVLSEYGRSDSMIILSVNKSTGKIHLASLMRALYVYIPGHGRSLLNAALNWGGPDLLLRTIQENFRIRIDKYMYVDFGGFQQAVDILGGVDIPLNEKEAAEMTKQTGNNFVEGMNHLNGHQALTYSRIRYIDSDFVRTSRQRNVVAALITKTRVAGVGTITTLVNQLIGTVRSNINSSELVNLAIQGGTTYVKYPVSEILIPLSNDTTRTYTSSGAEVWTYSQKSINALTSFLNS